MKLPVIRESYFLNIVILLVSLFVSWFTLLIGLAHIIEGRNPNVPYSEHIKGFTFCIILCIVGVIFLLIAIASIKGILYKIKNRHL